MRRSIRIERTWQGESLAPVESAILELERPGDGHDLRLRVDAPYHGDPAPPGPPGSLDGLWEYEVVELFLLGADERYLEVEISPHGHYLVLTLQGARNRVALHAEFAFEATIDGERWRGEARIPGSLLPPGLRAHNAYAIHGEGAGRRYLAAHPVPGDAPDFHRLGAFAELVV